MFEYHCPECFNIPLYEINQHTFESIKIICKNNHKYEYSIDNFFDKKPFEKSNIKCHYCLSSEKNIDNLVYCLKCKKFCCKKDTIKFHNNCKNIINSNELFSTCLKHNYPIINYCNNCKTEICICCLNEYHLTHKLENIQDTIKLINNLKDFEYFQIEFINYLILKIKNNDNEKKKYQNLKKILKFCKNIFYEEFSKNHRYSNILYGNIILIYFSLYLYKDHLIDILNKNDLKINSDNNTDNKMINIFNNLLKQIYNKKEFNISSNNNIKGIIYNSRNNSFSILYMNCIAYILNDKTIKIIDHSEITKPIPNNCIYFNININKDLSRIETNNKTFNIFNYIEPFFPEKQ